MLHIELQNINDKENIVRTKRGRTLQLKGTKDYVPAKEIDVHEESIQGMIFEGFLYRGVYRVQASWVALVVKKPICQCRRLRR